MRKRQELRGTLQSFSRGPGKKISSYREGKTEGKGRLAMAEN